jgi:hypothetical protein
MSKFEKIIAKLLNPSSVITFQELEYILKKYGDSEKKTGKISGSRKAYINVGHKHIIRIHKPHPENEIKKYVKYYIIAELKKQNLI